MNRERPPPGPFTLLVLEHFQNDPVVSLERAFPPTHALIRGVQAVEDMPGIAVVEFELIDQPPAPTSVVYGGFFGESAFERAHHEGDREAAWFCFDATLPLDINMTRLRAHVRDSIALFGARGVAPACRDELEMNARSDDRKAAVRKRRRAPPPPEPPPPPALRPEASAPGSTPPPLPLRAKGSDRGRAASSSMPPELDPPTETHTPLPRRPVRSSIPPPPPEPPPPEPLPRRTSYRPPAPPDSLPTAIHRRRSNQPPPEPPPPPPFKRD
jgi:hypothetical protein